MEKFKPLQRRLRVAVVVPAKRFLCLGSFLWSQRYGPLQVASVLRDAGYQAHVFNEELGFRVNPKRLADQYDVIAFSCKSSAITRAETLARSIKDSARELGRRVVTVLGGEHVSMGGYSRIADSLDFFLPGESEQAFIELLDLIEADEIQSISSKNWKNRYNWGSFDNLPDLALVLGYRETVGNFFFRRAPLLWILKHRMLPMLNFQGSRGCPYKCSFCPTPRYLQGSHYRRRSISSAVACLKNHIATSGIHRVLFEDPTAALPFDSNSHSFFEALARAGLSMKATVLVRSDICEDRRLLELMRAAGVTNLSIGIESLNHRTRLEFNKRTSFANTRKSIDVFHEHGFTVTGLFIVGYDSDDLECFFTIRRFINETGIEKWKVSPLTQMLELDDQLLPAHRFFLWDEFDRFGEDVVDYGNGEFVLFYPKFIQPSKLQSKIMEFNLAATSLLDLLKLATRRKNLFSVGQRLGNNLAQRLVQKEILRSRYFEMTQEIEKEFYAERNGSVELVEDRLLERFRTRRRLCPSS